MFQWKKLLQTNNNYWIFPALVMIGTVFLIFEPTVITGVIWLTLIIRVIYTGNKQIIGFSLLFLIIMLFSCFFILNHEKKQVITRNTKVTGEIVVLPDKLKVDGDQLQLEGDFFYQNQKQKIVAFYNISSELEKKYWEKNKNVLQLKVLGDLKKPVPKTNLNGFDYQNYLKERGIYQLLTITKIRSLNIKIPSYYQILSWLSIFRKKALDYCQITFLKETAIYLKVLIFGFKSNEFSQREGTLANLGILHLFSLSGMHVTFFIGCFRYLALRSRLTVERLYWLQWLFSFIYAGLTGFSVSVIRALLQSLILLSNRQFRWQLSPLDCWSLTLIVCLITQPYLLFSIGGQLSYGLSFLIMYVQPIVAKIRNPYLQGYCFSLLLNIAMIPLIGRSFYEWQLMSSFFTFLLLPMFERVILPTLTLSLFISFFINLKLLVLGLEYYFLIQQSVFQWLNQNSTFTVVTGAFSPIMFIIATVLVVLLLYYLHKHSKKSYIVGCSLLALLYGKYLSPNGMVAFIDVGQGDSIFIQAPFHQENILIDTGGKINFKKEDWAVKTNQKANAEYSVIPFLKSKGVKYLDKVLISHGDIDHCGDLAVINEKIPIRNLYFPSGTENKIMFRKLVEQLKQTGTKCYGVVALDKIDSSVPLQMLAPRSSGIGENKDSMVLYMNLAKKRFLFTGDLEKEGEQELVKQFPSLEIDVLKVGHHGSKTSTDGSFIRHIQPTDGIISCGRDNRFKHPHEETLATLKQEDITVFQTDRNGMIYYEWTPFSDMSSAKIIVQDN